MLPSLSVAQQKPRAPAFVQAWVAGEKDAHARGLSAQIHLIPGSHSHSDTHRGPLWTPKAHISSSSCLATSWLCPSQTHKNEGCYCWWCLPPLLPSVVMCMFLVLPFLFFVESMWAVPCCLSLISVWTPCTPLKFSTIPLWAPCAPSSSLLHFDALSCCSTKKKATYLGYTFFWLNINWTLCLLM